jgi:hypothetical protein
MMAVTESDHRPAGFYAAGAPNDAPMVVKAFCGGKINGI